MRDIEIRSALILQLQREHPDTADNRIWSELSLCLGASRVDVCLINGALTGFEIKSPRDNLARLKGQVENYGLVMDYASIVVSEKYASKAPEYIPSWWGIEIASMNDAGEVRLDGVRDASRNPTVDPFSVAQLLWRDEAYDELFNRGLHRGLAKATRWKLWDRLVEELSPTEIQDTVRARLKARPSRQADAIHTPDDVKFL
jgi:hypothetical protein